MTVGAWFAVLSLQWILGAPDSQTAAAAQATVTTALAAESKEAEAYLHTLHARVHDRWARNFLGLATSRLPPDNPLNDPTRLAVFDLVIRGDGYISALVLSHPSGFVGFDDAAREVLRDSSPFPPPPPAVMSDDHRVHLRWSLARDARACEGLELQRVLDPAEQALPRLLHLGRVEEAVRRAGAMGSEKGMEAAVTILARSWLDEAMWGPVASVRAAAHVDSMGALHARDWLQRALTRPETAADAAAVLAARHRPVCVMAKAALESHDERQRLAAARALYESSDMLCAPGLMALLGDLHVEPATRAAAATALGNLHDQQVITSLQAASRDSNSRVRAAARVGLLRARTPWRHTALLGLLQDPSPEVRAQAAAALARARTGDVIAQLSVLAADKDPAPGVAAANALARVADPEAVRVLERLLTAELPEVRLAAARALMSRHDRAALGALRPLIGQRAWPELQALALAAAPAPQIAEVATAPDWGFAAYRAWLAQGDRERAGRWLLDHLTSLPSPLQVDAMCEWLAWR